MGWAGSRTASCSTNNPAGRLPPPAERAPPRSGCLPTRSGCLPTPSGCLPTPSGCLPTPSGCLRRPRDASRRPRDASRRPRDASRRARDASRHDRPAFPGRRRGSLSPPHPSVTTGPHADAPPLHRRPPPPAALERLREIAYNLWWSWAPVAHELFVRIDPELWEEVHGNPIELLCARRPGAPRRARRATTPSLSHLEAACATLPALHAREGWFSKRFPEAAGARIAYFSMEYGLHECLPIYSGGLGVLAGDHLKTASDLGLPLVGVGLAYAEGYFRQVAQRRRLAGRALPDQRLAPPARRARSSTRTASASSSTSPTRTASSTRSSGRCRSGACRCSCSTRTSRRTRRPTEPSRARSTAATRSSASARRSCSASAACTRSRRSASRRRCAT